MRPKTKYRRRRYFLPNTSQPRLLISVQIVLGAGALAIAVVFLFLFNRDLTTAYWSAHLTIQNVQQLLLPTIILVNLAGFLLSLVAFLFFTHRIVGPIHNLRRVLRGVAQGDLSASVRFRKQDYLHELAADANLALDSLRREIDAMEQLVAALARRWDQGDVNGVQPELREEVSATLRELHHRLNRFQLEGNELENQHQIPK